jgi:radical SAM superfamily enzyme YgiQ (UPF0313 family)
MPDSFEHTPVLAVRMPNGALASLAGNVDPQHHVAIADLVLAQGAVRQTVERLMRDERPDLVGLSVMTFQRATARRTIALIRTIAPTVRIVVGGYDPSLAPGAWTHPAIGVDYIVRGEGDLTFRDLVRVLVQQPGDAVGVGALRMGSTFHCTPARPVIDRGRDDQAAEPRGAGPLGLYHARPRRRRRGNVAGLHLRPQLLLDHRDAQPQFPPPIARPRRHPRRARRRARRFLRRRQHHDRRPAVRALCRAIVEAGLNDIDYIVQG